MFAFVPKAQNFSRWAFRLDPERRIRAGLRLFTFSVIGVVLLLFSSLGTNIKAEQEKATARRAAEKFERERLEREANAKVRSLVEQAKEALQEGGIDLAKQRLKMAVKIQHATGLTQAQNLSRQIERAVRPAAVRDIMVNLTDEEFEQLAEGNFVPQQLRFGYAALDTKAAELAKAQIDEVAQAREERRQEKIAAERETQERQRVAAEAARRAENRRRAEAKRQEKERERHMTPLVVENWSWHIEAGFAIAEGEVTNRSDMRLENVEVVVSFYTKDSHFITSSNAIVEFNPILPGQTTPFKAYATHNPQMKSAQLAFKHLFGGSIGYKKR